MDVPVSWRKAMMAVLLACFVCQTYLVYTDSTADEMQPLSEQALAGRAVWLSKNCQTCHQFYGFGGFLGPDLTNAAPRLDRARVGKLLKEGKGQMPAFHLSDEEIDNVLAYLAAIDRTGVGQARRAKGRYDPAAVMAWINQAKLPADTRRGGDRFNASCIACHAMLRDNLIGNIKAPDPTAITARLSDKEILAVLAEGRPERGMPAFGLEGQQGRDMLAFLKWLNGQRAAMEERFKAEPPDDSIPWFEYR